MDKLRKENIEEIFVEDLTIIFFNIRFLLHLQSQIKPN